MKVGAAVYALVTVVLAVEIVLIARNYGSFADVQGAGEVTTEVVAAASALLFAIGAITRRGLIADDGPWICRNGWIVLIGVTVAGGVIGLLSGLDLGPAWPTGPAVFLPHLIRRLHESYYDGVAEAERALTAEATDEAQPPAR